MKAAFDYHSKALRDALSRSNRVAAREHLAAMQSCAEQFEAIAEKEKEFSEDTAYKAELDLKLQVIKAVTPALSAQAMGLVAQHVRASGSQLQDLDLAIENLAEQLSSLGAAVQAYKGGRPERIAPPVPVPAAEANTPSIAVAPASDGTPRASRTASSGIDEASKQLGTLSVQGRPSQVSEGSGAARSSRTSRVEDEELHALTSAVSETVFVEAPAPQMLSAEEATQFPLRAAGQELKVEASVWATENNAVIEAVTSMSQRMLDLSEFHARLAHSRSDPAAKRSFIQAAQAIMVDANTLLKAAQPLVEACTDRRLRMQLQGTLTYITTLAQQLKIVAAVKASSPLDADKDVQLVSCAQNLMKTVKMGLRDCVACSLRVRKGSEAAAVAGIVKFRKVVYARD
ncbi:hypothetical protein HK105_201756 [Polyrhizophydium stewartii]|uniref:Uncharacterized protein n=1 Tax=Polyrhizophydium stewartii TaxID=2732419 RepID=A0ABR4NHA0_9FUNG